MKRIVKFFLVLMILVLALPMQARAVEIVDGGPCGELHWTLDSQGVLTISGAGAMPYCQME